MGEEETMTPRCLCCNLPLSAVEARDGWCLFCSGGVLAEVLAMRDGPPATVGARVAWLHDAQCMTMVRAVVGVVPFVPEEMETA